MYDYLCNYKKDPKNLTRLLGQNPGGDSLSTGKAFMQDAGNKDDNTNAQEQIFITNGGSGNANNQKRCVDDVAPTDIHPLNAILAKTRSTSTNNCNKPTKV
jgi:hypothetical protein